MEIVVLSLKDNNTSRRVKMPDIKLKEAFGKRHEDKHTYDAYVSHGSSEKDRKFVRNLAVLLEQEPYNVNLFLPDDVPNEKNNVEVISDVIINRCKRLLLVMSEDYAGDKMSDFTVQVAKTKPNCRRDRKIIPIVIDRRCGLPVVINHLTTADFTIQDSTTWVLPRLIAALKAPVSNTPQING